jgi:hydrogenase expression/formation protein HypD
MEFLDLSLSLNLFLICDMDYIDAFRRGEVALRIAREMARVADGPVQVMEVCGGHTHAIFKYGLHDLFPPQLKPLHGPGCPVCVTPLGKVDQAIALARLPNMIFTSYGDMLRVPGSSSSLLQEKARGADVRMVYSSLDALRIAREHPGREVVFFAIGFETTAPANAAALLRAHQEGVENFSLLAHHVLVAPAMKAVLDAPDVRIDGFVAPGHVSTIIGTRPYAFIAREYRRPVVVSGFEPLDLMQSFLMVLRQLHEGRAEVENQYTRSVRPEGNPQALAVLEEAFEPCDLEWRGLGQIPRSGLRIRERYSAYDAERRFTGITAVPKPDPHACQCGEILRGAKQPRDCKVFGTACTPETPIGACMVSSEGACAAEYLYGKKLA